MRIHLPAKSNFEIASKYLTMLQAFHKLNGQAFKLLSFMIADYIKYRDDEGIKNDTIIFDLIFSTKSKQTYKERLEISDQRMQNMLSKFRKDKVIVYNNKVETINKNLLPDKNFEIEFKIIKT